ncbi:MAG: cobalt ABC transporter ATP-binding protein [Acidobacteria bacterium]|nr:MAG: cobalt ABC transporter ATP-binding protein [Acidobacteriota bacterium]
MKEGLAIVLQDLAFSYESQTSPVLRGINLEVSRGEFTVIAGPSGAGKSTLCRTFNNIIPMFYRGNLSGQRFIRGELLDKQPIASIARKVGMVFQDFEQQLFSTNSLLELSFTLENFGMPQPEMKNRMSELLEKFGIASLGSREPFSLSGGEKQKLAIASVMAYKPEILVLDEPTTDLDPESREFVLQSIPKLKDWIETIVIIDHETDQFLDANRICLLRDGNLQYSGTPSALLTQSNLLESNSMAPLDLIQIQEKIHMTPQLLTPADLASRLFNFKMEKIGTPARSSGRPALQVEHLTFQYDEQSGSALDDISFEIFEGEFVGIVGNNGSGKSTLLKHLNGLQLPQSGTVKILNQEVRQWARKSLAQKVALVFQNPDHQIFHTTVREEVEFGPKQFGFPEADTKRLVDLAMETMDLIGVSDRDPFQLSKGERQRVAVASILSVNPDILILDEPTTGLDYRQQKYMMELLRNLHQQGKTIIIVTHAIKLVGEYCDHALLLDRGKKVAEAHPRDLFFGDTVRMKLPPLWALSRLMNGDALTVEEFARELKKM